MGEDIFGSKTEGGTGAWKDKLTSLMSFTLHQKGSDETVYKS
jgi:hypothetical protein